MTREDAVKAFEGISAAAAEINVVAMIFRERLDEPASKQMILGCGKVLASMHDELLRQIFVEYPELEAESRRRALEALSKKG